MKVLSLFDGIGNGMTALKKNGNKSIGICFI